MGYSFKPQPISIAGINTAPLSVSMSVTPGANETPMIGPEIGPDPRNAQCMITSPQRYFFNDEFLYECFDKLKGTICSCHLKDVRLKEEYTFQLEECACGEGALDIKLYARLAEAENKAMPMIIEHLTTDEEYAASVKYVRELLTDNACK